MFHLFQTAKRGLLVWLWLVFVGIVTVNTVMAEESASNRLEIRAYLVPRTHTTLSSHIEAEIQSLIVREGESFVEGATLVLFDCTTLMAQRNKAQALMSAAQDKNKIMQRLAELHSVGSMEAEAARSELDQATADWKVQESRIRGCKILAPFTGRVATLSVREHQYLAPGQVVMKILDHRHLEMEMIVPSRWLVWLKLKSPFSMHIDETEKNYPAQVIRIGAEADPVSQSVKIVAELVGEHPDLVPGMSGAATFILPEVGSGLAPVISNSALSPLTNGF